MMTTATLTTASVLYSPALTPRQQHVLRGLARGREVHEVARELGMHRNAVQRIIVRIASRIPGDGRPLFKVLLWAHRMLD